MRRERREGWRDFRFILVVYAVSLLVMLLAFKYWPI
jgi:hypothetical protein